MGSFGQVGRLVTRTAARVLLERSERVAKHPITRALVRQVHHERLARGVYAF